MRLSFYYITPFSMDSILIVTLCINKYPNQKQLNQIETFILIDIEIMLYESLELFKMNHHFFFRLSYISTDISHS